MSLSIAKAELIGVFLESLLYGAYFLIFTKCMQVLRRRQARPNDYLLGTAVSLFLLITVHLVIDIIRNMDAFTSNMGASNYPIRYYETYNTRKNIMKSTVYVAATIISDAFIVYRSFIVWGRSYLVAVIPFLLFLADIAIGVLWVYTLSLTTPGENVYKDALSVRVKVFYSVTLGMNVTCTCLIAFRVWKIQKVIAPFVNRRQDELSRLVPIIIESGSIYSAILVVMIITFTDGSSAMFIFLNSLCPVIGIVFSSVIVRVGLGLSHGDSHNTGSISEGGSQSRRAIRPNRTQTTSSEQQMRPFPRGSIQVALSQTVHTHVDTFQGEVDTDMASDGIKAEPDFHVV